MDNTNDQTPKRTEEQFVESLRDLFIQSNGLTEAIKAVKDEAKEAGFDATILATVAKALANAKEDELQEKSEAIASLIDRVK